MLYNLHVLLNRVLNLQVKVVLGLGNKIIVSVQGTVDLWSHILPIDRYSHTL